MQGAAHTATTSATTEPRVHTATVTQRGKSREPARLYRAIYWKSTR